MFRISIAFLLLIYTLFSSSPAKAGVTNPDISVLGQILAKYHDESAVRNAHHPTLSLGETELVLDAYLNPYAKGFFVFTADDDKTGIEEAYIDVFKGLPDGLALRGGKYRQGFGKLNPLHPHAYPFIEAPRVMAALLPGGDDGFIDTGMRASYLLPTSGNWASDISASVINGSAFHPDEDDSRLGWLSRWGNSVLLNDTIPLDMGVSATQGINNVEWKAKTSVYGADVKTKIPFSSQTKLTLQGEYFYNNSEVVIDTATGYSDRIRRQGFYVFGDLNFLQRWNAGLIYDQYNPVEDKNHTNRAIKGFTGFSLLEETTLLRLSYEYFKPENSPIVHTWMFQVVFSMGPHKAHQF